MKYIKQLLIILTVTALGEGCRMLIPLPVPGSVYGLLLMLLFLKTKIIKPEQVETVSAFLISVMPIMFVPSLAGLVENAETIRKMLLPLLVICIVTTLIVAAVSGLATEQVLKRNEKKGAGHE